MKFNKGDLVLVHNVLDKPSVQIVISTAIDYAYDTNNIKRAVNFVSVGDRPSLGFYADTNRRLYLDVYPDAYLSEPTKEQKLRYLITDEIQDTCT